MKNKLRKSIALLVATLALPVMAFAEDRVALGVITAPADETLRSHLGLKHGLVVKDVAKGSPAEKALRRSDILTKFDDQLLINAAQLSALVGARKKGDEVVVEYMRSGKPQKSNIVLDEFKQPAAVNSAAVIELFPGMSIDRKHFDPSAIEKLRKQIESTNQKLAGDRLKLPASAAGGDASISINGQKIDIQKLLSNALQERSPGEDSGGSSVSTSISSMTWNDNGTVYQLNSQNGRKTIKITDNGEVKHEGDFNTPEDRAAVPKAYLRKFDEFQGAVNSKPEKSENE